ncbi:MAG TPA: hypothetical protein PLG06_09810, partial [Anaerolineae bacterium]|nr:hypothetical protein [Anaerolineae bacterium]
DETDQRIQEDCLHAELSLILSLPALFRENLWRSEYSLPHEGGWQLSKQWVENAARLLPRPENIITRIGALGEASA